MGFRPFVYRLAQEFALCGWVQNHSGQVEILAQGEAAALLAFEQALCAQAPPLAKPHLERLSTLQPVIAAATAFQIRHSLASLVAQVHVPPDYFVCDDCLRELYAPQDRRYRYPFINCTQCGPRYTFIQRLPYDRPHTSMAAFPLCLACEREYLDPANRRFHAQPIACPECGPQLEWHDLSVSPAAPVLGEQALQSAARALQAGAIVAVKGIGGYHLLCDARNDDAVQQLRTRKSRPHKPLAVLFPAPITDTLAAVRQQVELDAQAAAVLQSPMRPILLLRKSPGYTLAPHIAPHLQEIGVFLPYSPLHHLLLNDFAAPLVATSANLSGEPMFTEAQQVETKLAHVTPYFLHHNRPILRPADDPVFRIIAGKPRPLRLGRGCAPLEWQGLLPAVQSPLLATGAQQKNTLALAWGERLVLSPPIGSLDSLRSYQVFQQVAQDLSSLYQTTAQQLACDAHPGYATRRWARQSGLPTHNIWHHHAHASALYGEYRGTGDWLVFTWDGVGLGADGTLWGGETFFGAPGRWQRVAHLRPFRPPGGDKAGRQPWRSALAVCWEVGLEVPPWIQTQGDMALLHAAWQQNLNCPPTSAAGRLFDAAASLCGLLQNASFEGQAPMYLEARCDQPLAKASIAIPWQKNAQGLWEAQWQDLIAALLTPSQSAAQKAALFHQSLAQAILKLSQQLQAHYAFSAVGLCGGVFQNRLLSERALELLQQAGFTAYLPEQLPANDAAISFGQVVEVAAQI